MNYVDYEYYSSSYGGKIITAAEAQKRFKFASNTVDTLTYCRICSRGFEALSDFQKSIIRDVICELAEWQAENADLFDNPYTNYSINGVSASWEPGAGVKCINNVMIPSRLYAELIKTGLCYPGV